MVAPVQRHKLGAKTLAIRALGSDSHRQSGEDKTVSQFADARCNRAILGVLGKLAKAINGGSP